jgi:hypothetical protein
MKKILGLLLALSVAPAFAEVGSTPSFGNMVDIQNQEARVQDGQRHMIEFNANSVPSLIWAFTKDKTKGTDSENDSDIALDFNYAYTIHPNIQVGGRFNYFTGISGNNDQENLGIQAVGWFNTKAGDLQNSPFLSVALGGGYAQTYGANGSRDDLVTAAVTAGKRFGMDRWGVKHLTWTPEVALTTTNSTNNSSFDYRQALEFRFVQFSVIW